MKQSFKKELGQQNLYQGKKSLDPYKNWEAVQRDLESWLFLLNVYGREKEFGQRPTGDITSIRKRRR